MKFNTPNLPVIVTQTWSRLALRDRQALSALVVTLIAVLAFVGLWQPSQQRLAVAERLYQQRLVQAGEVARAQAPSARAEGTAPLSTQLSERAIADGLDLQQLEVQGDLLRLTLRGDARALLAWLHRTEQDGATLQSLTLDKQGQALEAQVVVQGS
ncbi:type II secretion system protein GspM [Pseudomonas sp. H3(2019)]|uniref:type II secretion system protein GspM n=1 Tax=Pseudomonas sp. H3(2019) TaxID=2598724 RepID=UPI0011914621|nr:type II secretion system protein GspM [Pseudomonas sp. H3(2019)]TVT83244.1 type II secretion system protein M [Pseudomonas sp. H3(2019)]